MYEYESWAIKKHECQRIDALELSCCRSFLSVPWIEKRSHQSILKEFNLEYPLEGLMLNLKLQYFGHLMQRTYSLEKTLMLGTIEGRRRRVRKRTRWMDDITNSMDMSLSKIWEMVKNRESWHVAVCGVTKSWKQLSDWTTTTYFFLTWMKFKESIWAFTTIRDCNPTQMNFNWVQDDTSICVCLCVCVCVYCYVQSGFI